MTHNLNMISHSEVETTDIGEKLGTLIQPGDIICLSGDLGAGKTLLAAGIGAGAGVVTRMTSPTFTLINEYQGRIPLMHADLYRLSASENLADIGLDDYLYGGWACIIEWPERAAGALPQDRLEISISIPAYDAVGGNWTRLMEFKPSGSRSESLCEVLSRVVPGYRLVDDGRKRRTDGRRLIDSRTHAQS